MPEPPFLYAGGKSKIAPWILSHFPPHKTYCEVFSGSASVLLAKARSEIEILNDLNGEIVNFFLALRDATPQLIEKIWLTPYARQLYRTWLTEYRTTPPTDPTERAARWFFLQRSSFGGKFGAGFGTSKLRKSGFWSATDQIFLVAERLREVIIEQLDWETCIKRYDSEQTLFYCDPPYLGSDVNKTYEQSGKFESIDYDRFAERLHRIKGKAVVSHMEHPKIAALFSDWQRETQAVAVDVEGFVEGHQPDERQQRVEWVLCNFDTDRLF